jgi:hypothetical protein
LHVVLIISTPVLAVEEVNSPVASVRGLWSLWNIIVIIMCVARRKKEIGGWLLYYYIQLYSGAIFSILLLMISPQNYLPMTWGGITGLYILFLFSTVPSILIIFVELFFAERLRKSRNFEQIRPFRVVLWFHFGIAILGLSIDSMVFQDNVPLAVIGLISPTIWLPYFYKSKRVDRVFRTHDWTFNHTEAVKA